MADERFSCKACGHTVENPDGNRFALSVARPAVCPACSAPHVYEFGVQLDESWLKRQITELADLKRADSASAGVLAPRADSRPLADHMLLLRPESRPLDQHDDRAFGSQA